MLPTYAAGIASSRIAGSVVTTASPPSATVPIMRSMSTVENAVARVAVPPREASSTRAKSPARFAGTKLLKNSPTW